MRGERVRWNKREPREKRKRWADPFLVHSVLVGSWSVHAPRRPLLDDLLYFLRSAPIPFAFSPSRGNADLCSWTLV
jgi:hypothetical protein